MTQHRHSREPLRLEQLERRQLFTAFAYSNFASTAGIALNGFGSAAPTSSSNLILTDGSTNEARSALYTTPVPIGTFTSHFVIDPTNASGANAGDGMTFVIDNGSTTDIGGTASNLGYGAGTFGAHSVAIALDFFDQTGIGTHFQVVQGGTTPSASQNTLPVDFHNNQPIDATVTYDGTNLMLSLVDSTDSSKTFTQSEAIDLPAVLGSSTALIGFTAGSGNATADQAIQSWNYADTLTPGPVFSEQAAAGALNSAGTKNHLYSAATDSSATITKYSWSLIHAPSGAPTPNLSVNNSASAANPSVQYFKDGTYHFRVMVADSNGATTSSDVDVLVSQVATGLRLAPHGATIKPHAHQQFSGYAYDQFGRLFRSAPAFGYRLTSGGGSITSSGLYTASATKGHVLITVTVDDLTGTIGAVVV
ncbi:MAG: hypothetical protein JO353_11350 [Phycisphaerae bacterium]|nr:hypothetical protein [Phycisphaerae bacterium]